LAIPVLTADRRHEVEPQAPPARQPRTQPPRPGTPWSLWALLTLGYVLATIIMTWPYAARMADSLPPQWDPPLQVWVMRWVQHALATNPRGLYNANIFYPLDNTLAYTDSNVPAALLGAPFFILTGNAILTYNILLLGTFVLAGTGMCALVAHLTGNRAVGFLAGLAYAFLPYRYDHIWHLNQLSHAWTPWAVLALLALVRRQTWLAALTFGALAAIQVVSSFYVGFQLAFATGILLLAALIAERQARTWRFLARLLLAGAVFAAITLPLALPYLKVRDEQGLTRALDDARFAGAMPGSYLKVPLNNHAWGWLNPEHILGGEDTLFPGGLALLGAATGLWAGLRRRRALTIALLLIAALAFIVSLGPTWNARGGGTAPLPYQFLYAHFPFFGAMRYPSRFGVLADFAIVVLAGFGAAWAWERLGPRLRATGHRQVGALATGTVALLLLVELFAAPVRVERMGTDPANSANASWLAAQPDPGAVMHFPQNLPGQAANADDMLYATRYWRPLVYGYSGFIPSTEVSYVDSFTGDLTRPDGSVAQKVNFVNADNAGLVQDLGVAFIVVHREGYKHEDWEAVLAQLDAAHDFVAPAAEFGDDLRVYRVLPADPAPVTIDLVAPTVAAHGVYWEPALILHNPLDRAALTSPGIFRPLTFSVRWLDQHGHEVRHDQRPLTLPMTIPAGESVIRLSADQPDPPGPYTAEIAISGGLTVSNKANVAVYSAPPDSDEDGPPLALSEATVADATLAPGATLDLHLGLEARLAPPEDYTLFAQLIGPDGQVWGQYDAPAGWTGHYSSTWLPGEHFDLTWPVPLKPDAPPGQYRLLVGMYRHTATGTERITLYYPGGDATEYWAGTITVP
jgi:hypothetical protein